jgi:hypothetical protein
MEVYMAKPWLKDLAPKAAQEMGGELKQMAAHGAHEIGAGIFANSAFVMYPRGVREDKQVENVDRAPPPTPEVGREI